MSSTKPLLDLRETTNAKVNQAIFLKQSTVHRERNPLKSNLDADNQQAGTKIIVGKENRKLSRSRVE